MTGSSPRPVTRRLLLGAAPLAVLATTPWPARAAAGDGRAVDLRCASYNIRYGGGEDGVFDLGRTAAAIAELDADIVGLQEVDVHWGARSEWRDVAAELGRRLGMRHRFAPIYDFEPDQPGGARRQFGVAVLSRHPIVAFTNHPITRLSTQDADPVPQLMPGCAEAVIQARGARLHVYSTHLDYRADPTVRRMQVADTLAILADQPAGAHQVLTGDLNAVASAPEIAPLWQQLTNVVPYDPSPTYPAGVPTARIDHIAVSAGIQIISADVPDSVLARTASDHRPLVAALRVPRG